MREINVLRERPRALTLKFYRNSIESNIMASWLLIVFLSSVLTNLAIAWSVLLKHSIKSTLLFIIFLNSIVTSISSLVIYLVLATDIRNPFLCSCLVFGLVLTGISSATLNAMAARVR